MRGEPSKVSSPTAIMSPVVLLEDIRAKYPIGAVQTLQLHIPSQAPPSLDGGSGNADDIWVVRPRTPGYTPPPDDPNLFRSGPIRLKISKGSPAGPVATSAPQPSTSASANRQPVGGQDTTSSGDLRPSTTQGARQDNTLTTRPPKKMKG